MVAMTQSSFQDGQKLVIAGQVDENDGKTLSVQYDQGMNRSFPCL